MPNDRRLRCAARDSSTAGTRTSSFVHRGESQDTLEEKWVGFGVLYTAKGGGEDAGAREIGATECDR